MAIRGGRRGAGAAGASGPGLRVLAFYSFQHTMLFGFLGGVFGVEGAG